MKIFIELNDINKTQKILDKYLMNSEHHTFVYSNEGIFKVDCANLYKLNIQDKPSQKIDNYCNNISIIIDESVVKEDYVNQIPNQHILVIKKLNVYSLDVKSNIRFIIEINSAIDKIIDYYFDVPNDTQIYGKIFQDNFIEFLSLLN
jgi:hypothetical protein